MKKRFGSIALAMLMVVTMFVLAACGGTPPSSQPADPAPAESGGNADASGEATGEETKEPVELEFWTINLKKNFEDYIQGTIDEFVAINPHITINWVDVPGADVTQKMTTALAGSEVPDVINQTMLGYASVKFGQNVLSSISDYATEEQLSVYSEGLSSSLRSEDGKLMAVPWYNGGSFVQFINNDIYEQAGLDPEDPPTNFDDLLENGRVIHEKLPSVYGSNDFPTMLTLQAEGLDIVSEDNSTALFNSAEHVAFIQKFVDAYANGSLAPGSIGKDDRSYQQSFDAEQVGQRGWWFASDINNWENNAPVLMEKVSVHTAVRGSAGIMPLKDSQLFLVPARSEHPQEAVDFILYLTSPEKQLEFCKLVAIYPSTPATLEDAFFTELSDDTLQNQAKKIIMGEADEVRIDLVASLPNALQLHELYNEQVRAALVGDITVQEALDTAVAQWNDVLAVYS